MWLVIKDANQSVVARKLVSSNFSSSAQFSSTCRELIEAARPGKTVFSPMDELSKTKHPPEILVAYTSPDRDGVGRQGSPFYLWGVI